MNFPVQPPDFLDYPSISRCDAQLFYANNQLQTWNAWIKPRGITMVYMVAIGGGGGGGAGYQRTAGSAGGGGGSGACSGVSRLLIPAHFLPDVCYVQVGIGGLGSAPQIGGTTATSAGSGSNSYVSLGHSSATANLILAANTGIPGGGSNGLSGTVGGAGLIPTIATVTPFANFGIWSTNVGLVGVAGGAVAGAAGTAVTAWAALPLTPGAGGAGCTTTDFAGGAITPNAAVDWSFLANTTTYPLVSGGIGGSSTQASGNAGLEMLQPFYMTGGSGGASFNSGAAGYGGKGGLGCGGGGGGAGTTGGRGGDGGNGFVGIWAW